MVQVPLMVLAIQPGGTMTIRRAEELLRACPSQGRLYWVVCCECNPPPPTGSADDESIVLRKVSGSSIRMSLTT